MGGNSTLGPRDRAPVHATDTMVTCSVRVNTTDKQLSWGLGRRPRPVSPCYEAGCGSRQRALLAVEPTPPPLRAGTDPAPQCGPKPRGTDPRRFSAGRAGVFPASGAGGDPGVETGGAAAPRQSVLRVLALACAALRRSASLRRS